MEPYATECRSDGTPFETSPRGPRLERLPSVLARTGLSRTTLWRRAGVDFPSPVRLGPQTIAWVSEEVDQWIADRIAASRRSIA